MQMSNCTISCQIFSLHESREQAYDEIRRAASTVKTIVDRLPTDVVSLINNFHSEDFFWIFIEHKKAVRLDTENMSNDSSFHPPLNIRQTFKSTKNSSHRKVTVTTHHIGDWTIQESLKPFPQKENHSTSIKQDFSVQQWNIDDVCLFVKDVLGENCYTSIIQEHLIDGIALLLLKEEHLTTVFQMPSKQRIKLLGQINKLQI